MIKCSKCGQSLIRASVYDPEGTIALKGGIKTDTAWWVCINPACEEGKKNTKKEVN